MEVLEQVDIKLEWSDLANLTYHPRQDEMRQAGITHVSDVIRHVAIQHGQFTNEDREDEMPLRILLGLAFEEAAARLYRDMHWQPGQLEWDGVVGSPDGSTIIPYPHVVPWTTDNPFPLPQGYWVGGAPCVDEFKYTGKSQRIKGAKTRADGQVDPNDLKDIRTEWTWMQQGMAYVNLFRRVLPDLYEAAKMCLCRYHICWKYGDYRFPLTERYVRYLVRFTEAELRGNWAMLQAHKKDILNGTPLL